MARRVTLRVSSSNSDQEPEREEFPLSDFDHITPIIYTPVALIFKLEDHVDRQIVIDNLRTGLQRTLSQYRPLRGTLRIDWVTGRLSIRKDRHSTVEFITNWIDAPEDGFPSFEALEEANFSAALLSDDSLLPPHVAHKYPLPMSESDDFPVLVVQANIICGGLVLAFVLHHSCSDGTGMNGVLSQWAENTRCVLTGALPTPFDPTILDRSPLTSQDNAITIASNDNKKDPPSFPMTQALPASSKNSKLPNLSLGMFHFTVDGLARLKEDARPPGLPTVSSYDSMVAVLWRCIIRSRLPLLNPERTAKSRLAHSVELRKFLEPPLPARFLGNFLGRSFPSMDVTSLLDDGALPQIASVVRASILEARSKEGIKDFSELIARAPNKWSIGLDLYRFTGLEVAMTCWRHMTPYQEYDFGFGLPRALRWPKPMFDGWTFFYPRRPKDDPQDGVELHVCLEASCMERLLVDEELARYAHPRGN